MATEGLKAGLEKKLDDLKLGDKTPAAEEPEKFEDSKDTPVDELRENVVDELKGETPKLNHVETKDTTNPVPGDATTDGDVVKAEVPVAFEKELKSDHDIVPDSGAKGPESTATTETPKEESKAPSKAKAVEEKISEKIHKVVGKDSAT